MKMWVARFWSKVNVKGDDDCWLWRAEKNDFGYGVFTVTTEADKERDVNAHWLAFVLFNGALPVGLYPRHSCARRACCNPRHLYVSSEQEPLKIRRRGGARRKLSLANEMLLRAEFGTGCKQAALARKYGVSKSTVSRMLKS